MRPRSIAIVGASPEPASIAGAVLTNLERCGYRGDVHLVSRRAAEINGRRCVPAIDELPENIDTAVLVVPQQAVVEAVAACGRRRIGNAIIFASGFAEVDEAGRAEQERLARTAKESGVRLLGPNCIGYTNFADGVVLTFETLTPQSIAGKPALAALTQSGALAAALRLALLAKGLGVSHSISTGNEADLGAEDFLSFLLDDKDTRAVALFVEQIRRPQVFLRLAERARELRKPVVLLHPGKSTRARESAHSHTGALAGDHAVMSALLRDRAVVLVDTIEELIDVADLLTRARPPVGGAGIMTNSGAIKGFALDFAETIGLDIPRPGPATVAALKQALPSYAPADNPVDVTAQVIKEPEIWTGAAQALLADPQIGSLALPIVVGGPKQAIEKMARLLPAIVAAGKPAVVAALGDEWPVAEEFSNAFRDQGVPVFRSPERALRALAHATRYGRTLQTPREPAPAGAACSPLPRRGVIPEFAGKAWLASLGIPVPKGQLATDLAAAKEAAGSVGYPVALKAQAEKLSHKSHAGGVMLRLADEEALKQAWDKLQANVARTAVTLEGVLVEAMAKPGIEMIVGARRDPDWGPVLMLGLGGVWIETLHDVRLMPADLPKARIVEEIRQLKGAPLLLGTRGAPPADLDALAAAAARIGEAIRSRTEIAEIDINPLTVYAAGEGVMALDALIVTD